MIICEDLHSVRNTGYKSDRWDPSVSHQRNRSHLYFQMMDGFVEGNSDQCDREEQHILTIDQDFGKFLFSIISITNPLLKIIAVMDYLKKSHYGSEAYSFRIPLTRKQIAYLTGLKVDTVIRTVKKMECERTIKIEHGKIYY